MPPPTPKWREFELGPNRELKRLERTAHTVTQVGNQLFFLGGTENRRDTHTKYMFVLDLMSFQWTNLPIPQGLDGRAKFALSGHTATLVNDRILYLGGVIGLSVDADDSDLVFALDLVRKEFSLVETFGNPKRGKISFHTADFVEHRREIIVYGGLDVNRGDSLHPLFKLNTSSLEWIKAYWKGKAPPHRSSHASCLVNERLYIYGGFGGEDPTNVLNDMHTLDLSYEPPTFSEVKTVLVPEKRFATLFFQYKEYLFLFGGKTEYVVGRGPEIRQNDMLRFDLRAQEWHECLAWKAGPRPSRRCNHKAVHLGDRLLVFGGTNMSLLTVLELTFG